MLTVAFGLGSDAFEFYRSMQEKFAVAFGPKDRRIDNFDGRFSYAGHASPDTIDGQLMASGITDNASFADVLPARFELRLYQNNDLPSSAFLE